MERDELLQSLLIAAFISGEAVVERLEECLLELAGESSLDSCEDGGSPQAGTGGEDSSAAARLLREHRARKDQVAHYRSTEGEPETHLMYYSPYDDDIFTYDYLIDGFLNWVIKHGDDHWDERLLLAIVGFYNGLPLALAKSIESGDGSNLRVLVDPLLGLKGRFPPPGFKEAEVSDCLVILREYQLALDFFPKPALGSTWSFGVSRRLSLKVPLEMPPDASEALALAGPAVTDWGRSHLNEVEERLQVLLAEAPEERLSLHAWAQQCQSMKYQVFVGSPFGYDGQQLTDINYYDFRTNPEFVHLIETLTRQAENNLRDAHGLPMVGEGWLAETDLYKELQAAFPQYGVEQHAKPSWLKPQHLDAYFSDLRLAFEYQGEQHDHPVDFFGGDQAYQELRKRDARKQRLCTRHGVKLIYVYPNYDLRALMETVQARIDEIAAP